MSGDAKDPGFDKLFSALDFATELATRDREHETQTRALLLDLIELMDSFDRFFEAVGAVEQPTPEQSVRWRQTFQRIQKQLQLLLRKAAVTPVESSGQPADPHRHEIVGVKVVPGAAEGVIVEEVVRGYQWGAHVLRQPRVIVAAPQERTEP